MKDHWFRLDRLLVSAGAEITGFLIILLALAILCAPVAVGLLATFYAWVWAVRATGSVFLGWIAAILVFGFFCRYIWGARLQRASRRAAEAFIAATSG